MKKLILLVVILGLLSPGIAAYAFKYDQGNKWPTNTVYFDLDIAGWNPALIQSSASTWNNAKSPFRLRLTGHSLYGKLDGRNTVTRSYLDSSALAITNTYHGGTLTEIDTIFNNKFGWGAYGESYLYDVENVMTHEFGHWLCLQDLYGIYSDRNKTLYGYISKGETKKRSLDTDDVNGINYIY